MTTNETTNTCCFFGHKTIEESKSGTKLAHAYAEKHNRVIINILD